MAACAKKDRDIRRALNPRAGVPTGSAGALFDDPDATVDADAEIQQQTLPSVAKVLHAKALDGFDITAEDAFQLAVPTFPNIPRAVVPLFAREWRRVAESIPRAKGLGESEEVKAEVAHEVFWRLILRTRSGVEGQDPLIGKETIADTVRRRLDMWHRREFKTLWDAAKTHSSKPT